MSLLLTGSMDHALLAMVIEEARQVADARQNGFVGRTAVQKMMYFLKVAGVPMRYRFDLHHYGPFCDDILTDVEWLAADGVIIDQSADPQKYSDYAPAQAIEELVSKHRNEIEQLRGKVREVVHALAPMRPQRLELLATLDYLYRHFRASKPGGPWKESVIKRFHEVKPGRFPEKVVTQAYDDMVNAGIIEP